MKESDVWIEFPQEGETIAHARYTFQVCACASAMTVEVSVNGGPWLPCRESMGLWWFDWEDCADGEHAAAARIHKERGQTAESEPRRFSVKLG
jgi:hypothetical protein